MFVFQTEASSNIDRNADFTGHFIEVKQELLQEDAHESDMEHHDIFVKVRVCALHILMFSKRGTLFPVIIIMCIFFDK